MNKNLKYIILSGLILTMGCATKKYVNQQVAPIIDKVNALDQRAAANTHEIEAVNDNTQQAISVLDARTVEVNQKAITASQSADEANQRANGASARTDSLVNTIKNVDNYESIGQIAIQFPVQGAQLDENATRTIDDLAGRVPNTGDYVLTLKGNTDAAGDPEYNYELSNRRALAVAGYLAAKFQIPAYRIFTVGLGPDQPVAENKSKSGRAKNRRVDVALFTSAPATQANEEPAQSAAIK